MNRTKALFVAAVMAIGAVTAIARELNAKDEGFVKQAWMTSTAEFKLGKLAEKRGQSKFIRKFGTMMATHHKTAAEEAKLLAQAEKIELPKGLDSKHQALYNRLSKLRGSAFDREYKAAMFKGHREAYDAFVKARKDSSNSNVKNYAERYTPLIEMHLQALQSGKLM